MFVFLKAATHLRKSKTFLGCLSVQSAVMAKEQIKETLKHIFYTDDDHSVPFG